MDRAVGIPIVKEGWPFVGSLAAVTAGAAALGWPIAAAALGLVTAFTAWFFRNPRRVAPCEAGVVVAPGDGKVVAIEKDFEPRYLKAPATRLSIFLNVFNVHVNRVPCDGVVEDVIYQPGRFIPANKPDATLRNEQNAVCIEAVGGAKVLCVQVAGLIARRIVCWLSPGDRVVRGERYGLIRFGSRMDLFLPEGTAIQVAVGQRVKGGAHVVARLPQGGC